MSKSKNKVLVTLLCMFLSCVVLFGLTLSSPNKVKASSDPDFYVTGAQIRTDDTVAGIRFNVAVAESLHTSLINEYGTDAVIEFGAYIAPKDNVTNIEDLDANFPEVLAITSAGNQNSNHLTKISFVGGYAEYSASVMYNIPLMLEQIKNSDLNPNGAGADMDEATQNDFLRSAFKMDLIARPFYTVNGEVKDYGDTTNGVRSMRAIMDAAVIDEYIEESDPIVSQYLGEATYGQETAYYDITSGELKGYTLESDVSYAWRGKPVSVTTTENVTTISGVGSVASGADCYLSVFDAESNVKRVPVKCVTVIDSTEEFEQIFSSTETLSGYYMLGDNIDASLANLSGAIRSQSVFNGTFDGCGYTISNLDVSASAMPENWGINDTRGSLFGKLEYPAVIKNVGFSNVKANYAAVIASRTSSSNVDGQEVVPTLSNIYIDVVPSSVNFAGVISSINQNNELPSISNVVVNAALSSYPTDGTRAGSFFGSEWIFDYLAKKQQSPFANNYVISPLKLTNYYDYSELNSVKYDNVDGITRYETLTSMSTANNDLSSFSSDYWVVARGIVNWKSLGEVNDFTARQYSIADGELDLTDLGVQKADITALEIGGTKLDVNNGELPAMTLVNTKDARSNGAHHDDEELTLTFGSASIVLTKSATDKDFNEITVKVYTENGIYVLNRVNVYSKILKDADDLDQLLGKSGALTGYYVLANNINAEDASDLGARTESGCEFAGIFDGMGKSIYNLTLTNSSAVGSMFGLITAHAAIRNTAFVNVIANNCAVIASNTNYYSYGESSGYPSAKVNNLYIEVSPETTDFYGVIKAMATNNSDWGTYVQNVVVRYDGAIANDSTVKGAFFGDKNCAALKRLSNNYLISSANIISENGQELFTSTGVTKYANIAAMKADGSKDLSSFSTDFWTITDGALVWNTAPIIAYPVTDSAVRAYSIADDKLDLTGLDIEQSEITAVAINGTKLAVENGVLPAMVLKHSTPGTSNFKHNSNYTLQLTVSGLANAITLNKDSSGKGFESLTFTVYTANNTYVLTNVKVYSDVIESDKEFEAFFNQTEKLDGYYVLGAHIDASELDLAGAKRYNKLFSGIFDGMGYTVSNLDVSSDINKGSLFGKIYLNAVVRNVAFLNVMANGSSVIADSAAYDASEFGGYPAPMISNVYVEVSKDTTDFYGIVGGGPGHTDGHARISNVIVKYEGEITGDDTEKAKGAFIGYTSASLTVSAMLCVDCYLISSEYITTLNGEEAYNDTDIVRYESEELMKEANNNYSTFNYCWTVTSGEIPVWANLPEA